MYVKKGFEGDTSANVPWYQSSVFHSGPGAGRVVARPLQRRPADEEGGISVEREGRHVFGDHVVRVVHEPRAHICVGLHLSGGE